MYIGENNTPFVEIEAGLAHLHVKYCQISYANSIGLIFLVITEF